jgi:hypothetical protein
MVSPPLHGVYAFMPQSKGYIHMGSVATGTARGKFAMENNRALW